MQDDVLNEIAAIAAHFMKLMDPRLVKYEGACAVLALSQVTVAQLAAIFELSEGRQQDLQDRMAEASHRLLAERQNKVH